MKPIRLIQKAAFPLALFLLTAVSLYPRVRLEADVPASVRGQDSPIHAFCYLLLAASWAVSFGHKGWKSRVRCFLFCTGFGLLMEILQLIPAIGRSFGLKDIAMNAIGAAAGSLLPDFRKK